jgi:protein ImuA
MDTLHRLRLQIQEQQQCGNRRAAEIVTSGFAALDDILPAGGLRRGTLVEWLAEERGGGTCLLALTAAVHTCRERTPLVVVDRRRWFNPLPALALGVSSADLVVVHPRSVQDETWTLDQALRCRAVGAVIAWPERLDGHTFRRLQLAAEASGAIGTLVRPAAARADPSWADVRLVVRPGAASKGWRLDVELIHCCSGRQGGMASVFFDELTGASHETDPLPVVSELVDPAANQSPFRA